jgi:hypothetical protein
VVGYVLITCWKLVCGSLSSFTDLGSLPTRQVRVYSILKINEGMLLLDSPPDISVSEQAAPTFLGLRLLLYRKMFTLTTFDWPGYPSDFK